MTHFKTLTLEARSKASLPTLWHAWTAALPRRLWLAPLDTPGLRIVDADTRIGAREVLSMDTAEGEEATVATEWIELSTPQRSIHSEVLTIANQVVGASLITGELSGSESETGRGARLKVTIQMSGQTSDIEEVYRAGFSASLLRLLDAADRMLVLRCFIPAAPQEIWAKWISEQELPRWWGPNGFYCKTKRIDLREGGEWVFDMIASDGTVFPNHHLYHRLIPQRRIEYSLLWGENGPKHADAWASLQPSIDGTAVTLGMIFATAEECTEARHYGAPDLGMQTLAKLSEAVMGQPRHTPSLEEPRRAMP